LLHFEKYGDQPLDALKYAANNSFLILNNIFNEKNMLLSVFIFVPNLFAFFAPYFLLPVIPEIGYILIRNQHSSGQFLVLAFVFLAAIYGTERLIRFSATFFKRRTSKDYLLLIMSLFIIGFTLIRYYYIPLKTDFGERLGPLPFTAKFNPNFYRFSAHAQTGEKIIKMIPEGASCLTLQSIGFHLGQCRDVGVFSRHVIASDMAWDYIFVDLLKDDFYQISRREYFLKLKRLLLEENYGVMHFEDGWLLLKRGHRGSEELFVCNLIDNLLNGEK
jgi:hypothetical protein